MTYCAQCGSERPESAAFCGKCGAPRATSAAPAPATYTPVDANGFVPSRVITTFVLALFVPVVALFLAISGRRDARLAGPTADALNRIALIMSIVSTSVLALYLVILMIIGIVAATAYNSYY